VFCIPAWRGSVAGAEVSQEKRCLDTWLDVRCDFRHGPLADEPPSTVSFLQLSASDGGRSCDARGPDFFRSYFFLFPRVRLAGIAGWAEALLWRSRRQPSVRLPVAVCQRVLLRISPSTPLDRLLTRTCLTYVAAPTSGLRRRPDELLTSRRTRGNEWANAINLTNDDNAIYFNFHVISSKAADAAAKMLMIMTTLESLLVTFKDELCSLWLTALCCFQWKHTKITRYCEVVLRPRC